MNDEIQITPELSGTLVEQIDKKDITPLNDPLCVHEFVKDDEDVTDDFYAVKCTKCPVGRLVRFNR